MSAALVKWAVNKCLLGQKKEFRLILSVIHALFMKLKSYLESITTLCFGISSKELFFQKLCGFLWIFNNKFLVNINKCSLHTGNIEKAKLTKVNNVQILIYS